MGVGGTLSHRLSPKSGLSTDLLHQIHAAPCFVVLVVCCQQFPWLKICFSSILLFGMGVDGVLAAKKSVKLKEVCNSKC